MEKVRTNQGGIAICVRLRTGGEGVLDFPHFSAYVLCGWPLNAAKCFLEYFRRTICTLQCSNYICRVC